MTKFNEMTKKEQQSFKTLYKLAKTKQENDLHRDEVILIAEPTDIFMEPLIFHITKNK